MDYQFSPSALHFTHHSFLRKKIRIARVAVAASSRAHMIYAADQRKLWQLKRSRWLTEPIKSVGD
jgi:hypothetical protein